MTMVRIELPDVGAEVEIRTPERTIVLKGGDHVSLDLESEGSRMVLALRAPAEGVKKFVPERESPLRW